MKQLTQNTKRILIFLLSVFLLAILIVLGVWWYTKNSKPKNITLHYWGLWEPPQVMEPLIKQYEEQHPNIKIEYVQKHFGNTDINYVYKGTYQDALEERIKQSGGVDIVRIHYTWVAKYLKYLYPAPKNIFNINNLKQDFYPALVDGVSTSSGNVYAMPLYIDGLVLFYNKKLLSEAGYSTPPQTWDDAIAYARTLTKKDANGDISQSGLAMGTITNILHSPSIIMLMFTQANVPVIDLKAKTFQINSREAKAALDFYASFAKKVGTWNFRLPSDLSYFAKGKVAMMIAPAWRVQDIVNLNPDLEFDIAPVPVIAGASANTPQYLADFWVEAVPRNSKYPKEAWEFLNWLSQPEQLRQLYANQIKIRLAGEAYPRISMAGELQNAPFVSTIVNMAPSMKTWQVYDIGIWETEFKNTLGPIESSSSSYSSYLDTINTHLNNLIFPTK